MKQRVWTYFSAASLLFAGVLVFASIAIIAGKILGRASEDELLSNRHFAAQSNSVDYEHWTRSNDSQQNTRHLVLVQTVDTPFADAHGNWRIIASLHVTAPSARIVYSIDGETLGTWKQLDRREVTAGSSKTKLVLEPRTLSPISIPPDRLRVTIDLATEPDVPIALHEASIRTGQAGVFNSLNPPTWNELTGIAIGLTLFAATAIIILLKRSRMPSSLRSAVINGALLLLSAMYTLIALEVVTRTLLVFPDSMATTRVSELWWGRHWKPLNELGYRDISHSAESVAGKKVLFVVGDSFAAGHGIALFEDIFHQRLAQRLGSDWEVVVLAKPGLSTREELDALRACPLKPDAIIVAHVWNDVNSALLAHGISIPGKPAMPPALRPAVLRSYFLDFLYWRIRGLRAPMRSYLDMILSAYADGAIWETHANDLSEFVDYAEHTGAPLLIAAFPALEDISASRLTSSRVAEYFKTLNVQVIDFADVFEGENPAAITVNPFDSHPNEAAHARIAEELYVPLNALLSENPSVLE